MPQNDVAILNHTAAVCKSCMTQQMIKVIEVCLVSLAFILSAGRHWRNNPLKQHCPHHPFKSASLNQNILEQFMKYSFISRDERVTLIRGGHFFPPWHSNIWPPWAKAPVYLFTKETSKISKSQDVSCNMGVILHRLCPFVMCQNVFLVCTLKEREKKKVKSI